MCGLILQAVFDTQRIGMTACDIITATNFCIYQLVLISSVSACSPAPNCQVTTVGAERVVALCGNMICQSDRAFRQLTHREQTHTYIFSPTYRWVSRWCIIYTRKIVDSSQQCKHGQKLSKGNRPSIFSIIFYCIIHPYIKSIVFFRNLQGNIKNTLAELLRNNFTASKIIFIFPESTEQLKDMHATITSHKRITGLVSRFRPYFWGKD